MIFKSLFQRIRPQQQPDSLADTGANIHAPQVDTASPVRWGIYVLFIGFGSFLLWAAFAPLDEGVPTQGSVSIDTKRKVVQHQTGGIVRDVRVREGQMVQAGEVLLTFDDSSVKARLAEIRQHYIGLRAAEGRLIAEQTGAGKIQFHPDLAKLTDDPLVQQHMRNQEMLLAARRSGLAAELQGIEESIQGQEAQIQGLTGVLQSRKSQRDLISTQLSDIRELVQEGYAPRVQQQELELKLAQSMGDIADAESGIIKSRRAIAELRQRALARKGEYRKEVEMQMAQVGLEVDADAQKLKALTEELGRMQVRSPVSGQVMGLQFQTVGSVVQPGQKILDVVPLNEGLLLEAKIAPHLIDRVHAGQVADVRFSSFASSPLLAVEGRVESISNDLLTEPNMNPGQPGASYYLARVVITPEGLVKLGHHVLQPGMPVQIVIKTGERSLLTYLLHPFMKRITASLKEE